jgi:hypothetical protein
MEVVPISVTTDGDISKIDPIIGQLPVPWRIKTNYFCASLFKSNEESPTRVVKYDIRSLHIWKALTSVSHTLLGDMDTWYHLTILTVICFITMGITIGSGSYKSIGNTIDIGTKSQILISFVLAGYMTIVVNRWDRIRNVTLGQFWGALENLNQISCEYLHSKHGFGPQEIELSDRFIRYTRLTMQLLFLGIQGDNNLSRLVEKKLLLESEKECLETVNVGTRSLMVVGWMHVFFIMLKDKNYENNSQKDVIMNNLNSLRGGIGSTMATVGTPLPYPYVHLVYWIIQISLLILAVETGLHLAIYDFTKKNGN